MILRRLPPLRPHGRRWMRLLTALPFLTWGLGSHAQTRIHMYADEPLLWRDMVAHVEDGVVRLGPDWRGDIVFTLHGGRQGDEVALFQGFSTSALDVLYTVRDGQLCVGDSHFSDAILYTVDNDQIFQGDSTFPFDVIYSLREEAPTVLASGHASGHASGRVPVWGLYREDSRSWSDRVALFEGKPHAAELFALLLASGWL